MENEKCNALEGRCDTMDMKMARHFGRKNNKSSLVFSIKRINYICNMLLIPVPESGNSADPILCTPECVEILNVYKSYYPKTGYDFPWIGYFILHDGQAVGTCGFTRRPFNNRVEIAYYTFPAHEGNGIATWACKELTRIAKEHKPEVLVTAKTAPEENASTAILRKNGFRQNGIVQDDEIGSAWLWILEIILA